MINTEMMQIFYVPEIINGICILDKTESHHCSRVLRKNSGDIITCVDGLGGFYLAELMSTDPARVMAKIIESQTEYEKRNYYLHVAIAPTKNIDRFEWFIEKATEIGVDEITPILCKHSERKQIKIERLEKIVISAMKQSVKAYKPQINELIPLHQFMKKQTDTSGKFIAYCSDEKKDYLYDTDGGQTKFLLLVGPEGDFSKDEITKAEESGYIPVSLGNSRLRTETAGVAVCQIIATRFMNSSSL